LILPRANEKPGSARRTEAELSAAQCGAAVWLRGHVQSTGGADAVGKGKSACERFGKCFDALACARVGGEESGRRLCKRKGADVPLPASRREGILRRG
jgi:hypothetical protein